MVKRLAAEKSCSACGACGDTEVTGQIKTGSKCLEKCRRVFNTDMTSWLGATNNARQGIAGAEERHPSHPPQTTISGPSIGVPRLPDTPGTPSGSIPAASFSVAVPGEILMYKTTPNKPSLLKDLIPRAWSRLLSRLIFKYLTSSRIFSCLGGKAVGGRDKNQPLSSLLRADSYTHIASWH